MITITASSRYKINRHQIRTEISPLLITNGINGQDVLNIVFVGKNKMRKLTQKYKHENETLPVLSFPYHGERIDDEVVIGEVVVCYPLTILLAAERNKPVDKVITDLLKHGVNNLLKVNVLS